MGYGTGRVNISTHQKHTLGQNDSDFRLCGLGEQIDSCGREIFSVDLTVCMLQTC